MNDILKGQAILQSWTEAAISLIRKEGLDSTDPKNYTPISLLNVDYKLFAGILASRLLIVFGRIYKGRSNWIFT